MFAGRGDDQRCGNQGQRALTALAKAVDEEGA